MLVKLEKFVELRQGLAINAQTNYLISNHQTSEFSYPLLKIVDLENKNFSTFVSTDVSDNVIAKQDDIIYTRTGQIGLAFRGFEGVVHNNSFIVSLISNEIDKDFLFVILNSDFVRKQALKMAKNSVQPDLTHAMFKSIQIPIYEKSIQKKIAKIILELDLQLERNNNMVKRLQVLALNSFDYFSKDNDMLNSVVLKDIIVEKDKSPIQVNNIQDSTGLIPFFTSGEAVLYTKEKLTSGFNIFLSTGGNAKVQSFHGDASYSTDTWCISAKYDLQFYLYGYLKHIETQMDKLYFHGTGLKHLQKPIFLKSVVAIPDDVALKNYNSIVEPIYIHISQIQKATRQLQQLKYKLLPLLINGQIE